MATKHEYRRVYFPRGRGKLALLAGYICTPLCKKSHLKHSVLGARANVKYFTIPKSRHEANAIKSLDE